MAYIKIPMRMLKKIIPYIAEFSALILVSMVASVCSSAAQKIGVRFSKKPVYNKHDDYQI